MEIANETLPKSIEAKEFSALFCRDRHASGNVLIKTDFAPEEYTRVYYFVGNIDGELKFIVNASFVPDELSDGLDVGAYSYGEEDSSSVIFEN